MEFKVEYNEVVDPIKYIELKLTQKEAILLKVLTGNICGVGQVRDFADKIWNNLEDIPEISNSNVSNSNDEYRQICKDSKYLEFSWDI